MMTRNTSGPHLAAFLVGLVALLSLAGPLDAQVSDSAPDGSLYVTLYQSLPVNSSLQVIGATTSVTGARIDFAVADHWWPTVQVDFAQYVYDCAVASCTDDDWGWSALAGVDYRTRPGEIRGPVPYLGAELGLNLKEGGPLRPWGGVRAGLDLVFTRWFIPRIELRVDPTGFIPTVGARLRIR